ncbi:inositol monophosphatase family protein [Roseibium salinum]|uniref:Inositol monophosphatase n=1 Tax=Roseibium salinum TaxID=1604349 RepID=A0ABT3QVT6_9HYPH|nr:inositol monophosphatase family protein [Roseibium sp. DSM 29163]MCX2720971.1 inositol monophosphatase [Roseibium sp. DSM 29163]
MAPTVTLESRFALAEEIAEEAGALALDYFLRRRDLQVEIKTSMQDVVSIADRDVETLIRQRLEQAFPQDGILGEEHGYRTGTSGYTWVVDPIDGTSAFVHGLPNWCVSIALLAEGEPVVGVIRVPCERETFAAMKGGGATLNGEKLQLDPSRTLQNSLTGIGGNHHVPPAVIGTAISNLLSAGGNYIRTGSGAQMLAWVAAGRLAGYFEPYMHAWDCLAGYCLISEAGGHYLPFPVEGDAVLNGSPVLAAGPGAYEDLLALSGVAGTET